MNTDSSNKTQIGTSAKDSATGSQFDSTGATESFPNNPGVNVSEDESVTTAEVTVEDVGGGSDAPPDSLAGVMMLQSE